MDLRKATNGRLIYSNTNATTTTTTTTTKSISYIATDNFKPSLFYEKVTQIASYVGAACMIDRIYINGYNYDHLEVLMKSINATEAKKRLLELIRESDQNFERYCIMRNGVPKAILMSVDDYDGWLETLEIMSSKNAIAEIKKARRELEHGKGISFENLSKKLSAKI